MPGYLLAALVGLAVGRLLREASTRLTRGASGWGGAHPDPPGPGPGSRGALLFRRLPLMELAGGLLALGLWVRFPGSPLLLAYGPFVALLLVLTALDLEHQWLPDVLTLPGIALGLALALVLPQPPFYHALLGVLMGWLLFAGVRRLYGALTRGSRQELPQGLGGGDVKLLALIGAFLGFKALPGVLLMSALLGGLAGLVLLLRPGRGRLACFPYGPCLALAALGAVLGQWGS